MFVVVSLMMYHIALIGLMAYPVFVLNKDLTTIVPPDDNDFLGSSDDDKEPDEETKRVLDLLALIDLDDYEDEDIDDQHQTETPDQDGCSDDDEVDAIMAKVRGFISGNVESPIAEPLDETVRQSSDAFMLFLNKASPFIESLIGPEETKRVYPDSNTVTGALNELTKLNAEQLDKISERVVTKLSNTLGVATGVITDGIVGLLNHNLVDNNGL